MNANYERRIVRHARREDALNPCLATSYRRGAFRLICVAGGAERLIIKRAMCSLAVKTQTLWTVWSSGPFRPVWAGVAQESKQFQVVHRSGRLRQPAAVFADSPDLDHRRSSVIHRARTVLPARVRLAVGRRPGGPGRTAAAAASGPGPARTRPGPASGPP